MLVGIIDHFNTLTQVTILLLMLLLLMLFIPHLHRKWTSIPAYDGTTAAAAATNTTTTTGISTATFITSVTELLPI